MQPLSVRDKRPWQLVLQETLAACAVLQCKVQILLQALGAGRYPPAKPQRQLNDSRKFPTPLG